MGVIFKSAKRGSEGVGRKGGTSHQDTEQRGREAHQVRGEIGDQRRKECQVSGRRLAGATETVPETQNRTWPPGLSQLRGMAGRRGTRKPLTAQERFSSVVLQAVTMPQLHPLCLSHQRWRLDPSPSHQVIWPQCPCLATAPLLYMSTLKTVPMLRNLVILVTPGESLQLRPFSKSARCGVKGGVASG